MIFAFSLLALPAFRWLKNDTGRRFVGWLGGLCSRRGGLFLFLVPLVLVQLILRPFFPAEHDWADFVFLFLFFVSGYVLYCDEQFQRAVRRDWLLMLVPAILSTLFFFAAGALDVATQWMETTSDPGFYLLWSIWAVNAWCWTLFMLSVGMRRLDFTSRWLQYGQETILPFFLFHQTILYGFKFVSQKGRGSQGLGFPDLEVFRDKVGCQGIGHLHDLAGILSLKGDSECICCPASSATTHLNVYS